MILHIVAWVSGLSGLSGLGVAWQVQESVSSL